MGTAWLFSLGPLGLAVEFLATVALVFTTLWMACKRRSPVFWKRTDYYYFVFTILGGVAGAVDIAVGNWNRQLQEVKTEILADRMALRSYVSEKEMACKAFAERSPEVIGPENKLEWDLFDFVPSTKGCKTMERMSAEIDNGELRKAVNSGLELLKPLPNIRSLTGEIEFFQPILVLTLRRMDDDLTKEDETNVQLASLSYFSLLKSLSPILLGLGIGIRLARTHYDVKAEEARATQ